jgi:hypothetical protein
MDIAHSFSRHGVPSNDRPMPMQLLAQHELLSWPEADGAVRQVAGARGVCEAPYLARGGVAVFEASATVEAAAVRRSVANCTC